MDKPAPFALDLDKLTQEQLDRALANPGSCKYSGPCIIGAMLPDETLAYIKEVQLDASSVRHLVGRGLVTTTNYGLDRARAVQMAFDNLRTPSEDMFEETPGHLRQLAALLPHLTVPTQLGGAHVAP